MLIHIFSHSQKTLPPNEKTTQPNHLLAPDSPLYGQKRKLAVDTGPPQKAITIMDPSRTKMPTVAAGARYPMLGTLARVAMTAEMMRESRTNDPVARRFCCKKLMMASAQHILSGMGLWQQEQSGGGAGFHWITTRLFSSSRSVTAFSHLDTPQERRPKE